MGCLLTVVMIVVLAPRYGFMACAWASVVANGGVMLISYLLGQKYYPVHYELRKLGLYTLLTTLCYGAESLLAKVFSDKTPLLLGTNSLILLAFVAIIFHYEVPKGSLALLKKKLLGR